MEVVAFLGGFLGVLLGQFHAILIGSKAIGDVGSQLGETLGVLGYVLCVSSTGFSKILRVFSSLA